MTAPTIIQLPGVGEQIREGLAPLLAALQNLQQRKVQEQQLQLQAAEVQSQSALRAQQAAALRMQSEAAAREAKGQEEATKLFQQIGESGQEFTPELLFGSLAKLKTSEGISAFIQMVPDVAQLLAAPAEVEAVQAGARVVGAEAEIAVARVPLVTKQIEMARDFLRKPNAKLPTDPTTAQAVGLQTLDLLGFVSDRINDQLQSAQGDAQVRMFARQAAIDVMRQSIREFNEAAEFEGPVEAAKLRREGKLETLEQILDRNAQAIIGISGAEVRRTVGSAFREFQRGTTTDGAAFNAVGLLSPKQVEATRQIVQGRGFQSLDADTQNALISDALAIVRGSARLPRRGEADAKIINLLSNLVRRLRAAK